MHRVFDIERSVGYETLLDDVMIGDQTRFARGDTVEQSWRVMQPNPTDGRVGNRTFPTLIPAAMARARPNNYWHAPAVGSGVQRPKLLPALATLCCVSTVRRGELNRATPTDLSDAGLTETELIAALLSEMAGRFSSFGALALIMVTAMAVTPFLNNAATVLVMAPIAASFARSLNYNPDPFLMAVAIGAACDFLTPIGHQSNLLVMGPGGYSFGDYWRLGLPLSIIVVSVGVPLIALFWPFKPI